MKTFVVKLPKNKASNVHDKNLIYIGAKGKHKNAERDESGKDDSTETNTEHLVNEHPAKKAKYYIGPWVQACKQRELGGVYVQIAFKVLFEGSWQYIAEVGTERDKANKEEASVAEAAS